MKLLNLQVKHRRRLRATTNSKASLPTAEDLLDWHFNSPEGNQVWGTDSTYLWINKGWLCLAVALDLCSRRVVGCALDRRMGKALVIRALMMAVSLRKPPGTWFVMHTATASTPAMPASIYIRQYGMHPSMSC